MSVSTDRKPRVPLSDTIVIAVARLVDDAQADKSREPTHSDLEFQFSRARLTQPDPKSQGQSVGKAKRVRAVLSWALDNAPDDGEVLVAALIAMIRAKGGFRENSPNFVGRDAVRDASDAFRAEGFLLADDGEIVPAALDSLSVEHLTSALEAYVRRARRSSQDAALLVGTGKDLLEATAAHVIQCRFGTYSAQLNFPTLLGQAFTVLGLATPQASPAPHEPSKQRLERALYEAGCAVNALRNKEGTGHGRPWTATVSDAEARIAIELMGIIASLLLTAHKNKK